MPTSHDNVGIRTVSFWWTRGELNPWPLECESSALPSELRARVVIIVSSFYNVIIAVEREKNKDFCQHCVFNL